MLLRALALALAAADQARWVGRSKLELARSMHDRHYHRAGGPKATARCRPVALTEAGRRLKAQNRSAGRRGAAASARVDARGRIGRLATPVEEVRTGVVIQVQTMVASKSNLCEGSRADWRDGLAQCFAQLTGLRVVAHNDDGSCADCGTLKRTACFPRGAKEPPAALVLVLGGGEDKRLRFLCANHYCGNTGAPFWVDAGR